MGKYDDIINLPHHVSDYHKPMPMEHRAAQFAPFAALSGHEEAITETSRMTESFKELTDDEKNLFSYRLGIAIESGKTVNITYFVPDSKKSGGRYERIRGIIKKWDEYNKTFLLKSGEIIKIDLISDIEF